MVNPAEDIVNIWLQEIKDHFTISNVVVPKKTRQIKDRKVGGGRGKEIDIISTNGKGQYFLVEVSVSPSPRLSNKKIRLRKITNNAINKFSEEKKQYLKERFKIKNFHKIFIYSPKMFGKKLNGESNYCDVLKVKGIEAISFSKILSEVYERLNYMGYDVTRNYLFLLKKFHD